VEVIFFHIFDFSVHVACEILVFKLGFDLFCDSGINFLNPGKIADFHFFVHRDQFGGG
jgi:hypothetical protein